jgi:hypothetical protein
MPTTITISPARRCPPIRTELSVRADYVSQLKIYDTAFSKFFARLTADGITKDNTLFVITSDGNDHFAGSVARATPAGCNGTTVPCTYPVGAKGEVEAPLEGLLQNEFADTTGFGYDFDSSPGIWINGNPAQTDPVTRKLERGRRRSPGL